MTAMFVNTSTSGDQSPPKMLLLADGRTLYVWSDNGLGDTSANILQARIFNADGTPSTAQISLGSLPAIDGSDGFDWDNLDLDLLADGRVVISYVRAGTAPGGEEPVFAIATPTPTGLTITTPATEVQSSDTTTSESPPVTTVLDNGNILFVWSNNALLDDTPTMTVEARIYNPTTGTWVTNDFQVGNVAVDGTDTADVPNLNVIQLAGGNVVVTWARSNVETGGNEPVYTVLDQDGNTVRATSEIQATDTTVWESPAQIVALSDGRFIAAWVNDGYSDDSATMTLEARIFNADGTPASGDIRIGSTAVDGTDTFDNDQFTMTEIGGGRVVIGYTETYVTGATTYPFFTILDPATGTTVIADVQIPLAPASPWPGPPVIEALGDSGYFVTVYANGNQWTADAGLNFRIYDSNGVAQTGEIPLTTAAAVSALDEADGFDWDQVQLLWDPANFSFTAAWAGANDGSGTGAYTSGPISVREWIPDGVVTGTAGNDLMGVGYEDAGGDLIDGADGLNDSINAGAGNDTVVAGAGDDTVDGGIGNDRLTGGLGDDQITTGTGSDTVVLTNGGGVDTVTDFDMTLDGGRTVDQIDVSGLLTPWGTPVTHNDVTVSDTNGDGTGDAILTFAGGAVMVLEGVRPDQVDEYSELVSIGVPCFAAGTPIRTPGGWRRVEDLAVGDLVETSSGPMPVLWAGSRSLSQGDLEADPALRPVLVPAGVLGNRAAVLLSPQHAVLVEDGQGQSLLVRAKHLAAVGWRGVRVARGKRSVTYHHILLPRHAIVSADGMAAESLYPGPQTLKMLGFQASLAIMAAVARVRTGSARAGGLSLEERYGPRVHPLMSWRDVRLAGQILPPAAQAAARGQGSLCGAT
ncbi:MAG: Hint domain-containing protein [Paracoccaceae bacterium]|nr:Hint domain-containing protein [Paracoccaceae bacterium]